MAACGTVIHRKGREFEMQPVTDLVSSELGNNFH